MKSQRQGVTFPVCLLIVLLTNVFTYQITRSLLFARATQRQSVSTGSLPFEAPSTHNLFVAPEYQLAYNHTFGFIDTIANEEWEHYYQKPALEQMTSTSNASVENVAEWLYHNMNPSIVCRHPRKLGNPAGKWMCDPERWTRFFVRRQRQKHASSQNATLPCLVYSIGSKGNFRWEEDFLQVLGSEHLCEFHIFDPSPAYESAEALQKHPHWHYHAWGLRGTVSLKNYTRRRDHFFDFPTIRERLGHNDRPINIFKIDCEGCEWESMPDWLFSGKYPATFDFPDLHHILLETHSIPHPSEVRRAGNFGRFLPMPEISRLQEVFAQHGFVAYSKEVNTHQGLGRSVEFGFLRLSTDFFRESLLTNT